MHQQNHPTILLCMGENQTATKIALLNQCTRKGKCHQVQKHKVTMLHQNRLQNRSKNQSQEMRQNLGSGDHPECPEQQLNTGTVSRQNSEILIRMNNQIKSDQ